MSVFRNLLLVLNQSIVPKEYILLKCLKITSSTGSYISLNRQVTWGDKIIMDLEPKLYNSNWTTIACSSVNPNNYRFYYNSEGIAPRAQVGIRMSNPNTGVNNGGNGVEGLDEQRRTFVMTHRTNELSIKVLDIQQLDYSAIPTSTPANSGNWVFYASNGSGDRYRGKIYSSQIYDENNTLVVDLYPCLRKSDNVAGMYDIKNDVFYTSLTNVPFEYETL